MCRAAVAAMILAVSGMSLAAASTIAINEDFSSDPSSRWSVLGDPALFVWNSTAQNLEVQWDSSRPQSFFHWPIGRALTRLDSFSFELDLVLNEFFGGHEPGKFWGMQIAVGFLDDSATNAWFCRPDGSARDVFEINCYPPDYPTIAPSLISSGTNYAFKYQSEYTMEFPLNTVVHLSMQYDAELQCLNAVWTTNGVVLGVPHTFRLANPDVSNFGEADDYEVRMFSISNYRSNEAGDWGCSVFARGVVDNVRVTIPPRSPVSFLRYDLTQHPRTVTFRSLQDCTYALERSEDFLNWSPVVENVPGTGGDIIMADTDAPADRAFYRVRASK